MEILYFSSGILAVALVYTVVGVFKLKQQIDFLKIDIDQLHNLREIEIGDVNRGIEDVYKTIDSRSDKLETRLTTYVDNLNNNNQDRINDIQRTLETHLTKNS